jgi:electron transfer flavoprotein-quinone oxidoreductase
MPDFDAIVVGAGVAGCSAAYKLAHEGADVLLVERAEVPGSKNLSGGILYGRVLPDLLPNFYEEAPIERKITRNVVMFLAAKRAFSIEYSDRAFAGDEDVPANGVSVLRGRFDGWLAEKAEAAGASLVTGICVDSLIMEQGVCKGILAGDEQMTANCVIVADGINSKLTEALGQRKGFGIHEMGVGVKQVYRLEEKIIDERFCCNSGEGVAYGIMGDCTQGIPGGGFLYTNKDTLSVGVVVHMDHLAESKKKPYNILDHMLANPEIATLLRGAELVEYGAHMVAEGGRMNLPDSLLGDGWMIAGDAAGFASNNGFTIRGMDFAALSGILAAECVIGAMKKDSFSKKVLSTYKQMVDDSFIGKDMSTHAGAPSFMKSECVYNELVDIACGTFGNLYTQNGTPKKNLLSILRGAIKDSNLGLIKLGRIGLKAVKSL